MMNPTILFLTALLFSPLAFAEQAQSEQAQAPETADTPRISGGDGKTKETAIILHTEGPETIRLEYLIYAAIYQTRPASQAVVHENGRAYDMLIGEDESQVLYFDITAYWQHSFGEE